MNSFLLYLFDPLQACGDKLFLELALDDKLENYELPENSLVTVDAGECSWGC